ncbi:MULTISPECIES: hypothetical protein [unclassified Serinicoccus]|uniref:hypothetical protein n=1 Tax=unclassified Serinicoccus TaxID=2643101 RepID=UPI0013010236|nr:MULTISPECIES: hypothetical protein [unclassified Serinicoccus]
MKSSTALAIPAAGLAAVAVRDLTQRQHATLRSFPVLGHARYALEKMAPRGWRRRTGG